MKTPSLLFVLTLLIAPFCLAEWILIEDFESYEAGTYDSQWGLDPNPLFPIASNDGVGRVDILSGIEGTGGNNAAWFWSGGCCGIGRAWHQIPFPMEIGINEVGTLYFRLWQASHEMNWHVMISKVAAGEEPDNIDIWTHQAAILRYSGSFSLSISSFNGETYMVSNPVFLPGIETWYEYWMVLDNSFAGENQVGVGKYEVFRRGPDDNEPVLLHWGSEETSSKLEFRNQAYESLKSLVLIQLHLDDSDAWLIDDIHITRGKDLSHPLNPDEPDSWCGYPQFGRHVDTGSFLGWIYVVDAASPWVFSYSLKDYVYLDTCPDDGGSWVYVLN